MHANRRSYISWHLGRSYLGRLGGRARARALVRPRRTARGTRTAGARVEQDAQGFYPVPAVYRIAGLQIALLTRDDGRSAIIGVKSARALTISFARIDFRATRVTSTERELRVANPVAFEMLSRTVSRPVSLYRRFSARAVARIFRRGGGREGSRGSALGERTDRGAVRPVLN